MNGEPTALKDAESFYQKNPGSREWQFVLLSALEASKDYKKALLLLEKMSFSNPDDLDILVEKQLVLLAMGNSGALTAFYNLIGNRLDLRMYPSTRPELRSLRTTYFKE